jgi:hypothetical protein
MEDDAVYTASERVRQEFLQAQRWVWMQNATRGYNAAANIELENLYVIKQEEYADLRAQEVQKSKEVERAALRERALAEMQALNEERAELIEMVRDNQRKEVQEQVVTAKLMQQAPPLTVVEMVAANASLFEQDARMFERITGGTRGSEPPCTHPHGGGWRAPDSARAPPQARPSSAAPSALGEV